MFPTKTRPLRTWRATFAVCSLLGWVGAWAAMGTPAAAQTTAAAPFLGDRDMSVTAAATTGVALGDVVEAAEAAVVPARLFEERGVLRRGVNVTYRLVKLAYFDAPVSQWLFVAVHEVAGHGGRLRERFNGPIAYRVDAPVPYGRGGGATSFEFDREPTPADLLAVSAGGMDASGVAAELLASRAVQTGRLRRGEALRYLFAELDTWAYVQGTGDDPEREGHDVSDYLQVYNAVAGQLGGERLSPRQVRGTSHLSLANPMLGIAVYAIARHVWTGATDVRVPMLSLGGVRVLPLLRYRLAPYGPEWAIAPELGGRAGPMSLEVRIGRTPGTSAWGIAVRRRELAAWQGWQLGARVDVWRQPDLDAWTQTAIGSGTELGAEFRARVERPAIPLWRGTPRATVVVEVGLKSSGYVPGEPLGAGPILRVGLALPLAR